MNEALAEKLKSLPVTSGVYFHKNSKGEIIYIGKAAVLRNRVRQYYQASRTRDPKTDALVSEIADTDWTEVDTELDALFLEAELIRRYMPPYNILLRDDKSLVYVRISYRSEHPTVTMTRRPLDDGAEYLGPYFSAFALKRALIYLRKAFPYSTHLHDVPKRACLQYHLGLCPGIEASKTTLADYKSNLRRLKQYLKGNRVQLMNGLEREMKSNAKSKNFEQATLLRNQLYALKSLTRQIVFSDRESLDISKDKGLTELTDILNLKNIPRRIEGFDISHMQGTDNTASMVVFIGGVPDKAQYRKFKLRIPGNDDFAHMNEALSRRLSDKNTKAWGLPNLILIDGGKGQLSAAVKARNSLGFRVPMIGLAKREEEIILINSEHDISVSVIDEIGGFITNSGDFVTLNIPNRSHVVKLLQRIRDESHRFAVSYHSVLKVKRQTASILDEIPTVGPATRKKLIKAFGSMRGVIQARHVELEKVVGVNKAKIMRQYLRQYKKSELTRQRNS